MAEGVVFLSSGGVFPLAPFRALLEAGHAPRALLMPRSVPGSPVPRRIAERPALPSSGRATLPQIASDNRVPVYEIGAPSDPASFGLITELAPDFICVACFPYRLPASWLAAAKRAALNLHPSLLPAYRGPAPLFWQLREGERHTGVTLHLMDEGLDTGPIVAQAEVLLPEGGRAAELDRVLSEAGAALLRWALAARTIGGWPQPAARASRQPLPRAEDLRVPLEWSARRAFNFLRGAQERGPFTIVGGGRTWEVREALGIVEPGAQELPAPKGTLRLAFADGSVDVREA